MTGEGLTTSTFSSGTFLAAVAAAISTVGVADVQNLVVHPTVTTGLGSGAVLSLDIDFEVVTFEDASPAIISEFETKAADIGPQYGTGYRTGLRSVRPAPSPSPRAKAASASHVGVIVGATVGGVALVALIGGLLLWKRKHRSRPQAASTEEWTPGKRRMSMPRRKSKPDTEMVVFNPTARRDRIAGMGIRAGGGTPPPPPPGDVPLPGVVVGGTRPPPPPRGAGTPDPTTAALGRKVLGKGGKPGGQGLSPTSSEDRPQAAPLSVRSLQSQRGGPSSRTLGSGGQEAPEETVVAVGPAPGGLAPAAPAPPSMALFPPPPPPPPPPLPSVAEDPSGGTGAGMAQGAATEAATAADDVV